MFAAFLLRLLFGGVNHLGGTLPKRPFTALQAGIAATLLTVILALVILGTA